MSNQNSFLELLESSALFEGLVKGSVVDATVVNITRDKVELDVGYKGLGIIDKSEFKEPLEVGSEVRVYVEDIDDGEGNIFLSKTKELLQTTIENLPNVIKNSETVEMVVENVSRGGISGNYNGVYTFLPFSIIDVSPQKNLEVLKNVERQLKDRRNKVTLDVKIINSTNKNRRTVIASRKAVIEENKVDRIKITDLEENSVVNGTIKNITGYGAFIDLGGVDGLLHISDVSWVNVEDELNKLKVGDNIDVVVMAVYEDKGQVALSRKDIDRQPWIDFNNNYKVGQIVKARVNNIGTLGFFSTILGDDLESTGIDGFVRNSEAQWKVKTPELRDLVSVGEVIDLQIIEIDSKKERISLSLKRTKDNILQDFADKNTASKKDGSVHKISVVSKVNYGFNVVTDCGIRGFLSPSEIDWNYVERFDSERELPESFEAMLIECNPITEKVVFSTKRLTENPAEALFEKIKDEKIEARVIEITSRGVLVDLGDGVSGSVKNPSGRVLVGDVFKVKATGVTNSDFAIIDVEIK